MAGNTKLYLKILKDFKISYRNWDIRLQEYFERSDAEKCRQYAHEIKGIAGNIGAERLHEAIVELEDAFRQTPPDTVPERIKTFAKALDQTFKAIDQVLSANEPAMSSEASVPSNPPHQARPLDPSEVDRLRPLLAEIQELLNADWPMALEKIALMRALTKDTILAAASNELAAAVDAFDLDEALAVVRKITTQLPA